MSNPSLFTVYDVRSKKVSLWQVEDVGIDTAYFWESLFYDRMPANYEETRATNSVDLLLSGIFAADYVNAASMSFASEILSCQSNRGYYGTAFSQLLADKCKNGSVASYKYGIAGKAQEYIGLYQVLLDNSHPD
jgi:starch synthase